MGQRGALQQGSIADQVLAMIGGSGHAPIPRATLQRDLPPIRRNGLGRALEQLLDASLIVQVPGGFLLPGRAAPVTELSFDQNAGPQPVPEPLRLQLDAIQRRAHALRAAGQRASAVLLLSSASRHPALPAHVGAGFAALAALFRHHDPLGGAA